MSSQRISARSAATLRTLTYRLTNTPTKQLPHVAAHVARCLWNCKDILSTPSDASGLTTDVKNSLHRFRTFLSSLLQDRTLEGRWSAVVLAKAAVEAGGAESLSKSNAWVKGLLAILKKPDPPTTKKLAIITLTRIFVLTWDYSNLVREITTPALPAFISACLNVVSSKECTSSEMLTVLNTFITLLPRHHTVFRSHESHIRSLLLKILSSRANDDAENRYYTGAHQASARRLMVLLHHCTPKSGGEERWNEALQTTVSAAHVTCDQVFRSVREDWRPTEGAANVARPSVNLNGEVEHEGTDALGMRGWKGIFAGSERLISIIRLLQSRFETATSGSVSVPVGLVTDLLVRIFSVTVPPSSNDKSVKINEQVAKDEREAMYTDLPYIHVAALQLFNSLARCLGNSAAAVTHSILEIVTHMFDNEKFDVPLRCATYNFLEVALQMVGPSLTQQDVEDFAPILKACCDDLMLLHGQQTSIADKLLNDKSQKMSSGSSADTAQKLASSHPTLLSGVQKAASDILPVLFSRICPPCMPRKLRTITERVAILTANKDALVAAVLNPASKSIGASLQPSLLPLLAREYPNAVEVESLLRPRLPPIAHKAQTYNVDSDESGDEDEAIGELEGNEVEDEARIDGARQNSEEEPEALNPMSPLPSGDNKARNLGTAISTFAQSTNSPLASERTRSAASHDLTAAKRSAPEPTNFEASAKRLRASPVAEALAPEPTGGPDPVTAQTSIPRVMEIGHASSQLVATMPAQFDSTANATNAEGNDDMGGDFSDFEMPPLTMDPDTDPEDDEAEED